MTTLETIAVIVLAVAVGAWAGYAYLILIGWWD